MPRARARVVPAARRIALALALAASTTAHGQATTASVHGVVTTEDGTVPRGARVELRSREHGGTRLAAVDGRGGYRLVGIAPGTYDVTVRAIGYRQQRREAVRLVVGERVTLDFALARGAAELEAVVVTDRRVADVHRTDVSTPVLQEEIERLPLNTRNMLNLAAVAPGIRSYAPEGGRSVPAAGPMTAPRFINVYVDGVEWKGMYIGNVVGQPGLGSLVPQEAVREFRVYLNPYDAELTRGASWVISAVTHRGGNEREGSVFGFGQNQTLVARGDFQRRKPDYSREQAGLNLRGPLVHDRLFYSLSYEGQWTDNSIDVVPGRPEARPEIWDRYAGTFASPLRLHSGLLRVTAPWRAHTLDAIWATRHATSASAFGTAPAGVMLARDAGVSLHSRVNSVQLVDTWTGSSAVNELTLHFLEGVNDERPLAAGPTRRYPGIQLGINTFPLYITSRHVRVVDKTSWSTRGPAGPHLLKSGLEATRVATDTYRPTSANGLFLFDRDTSTLPSRATIGLSLADPASTRGARAPNTAWLLGAYLQDEWRPVDALTVTAGLRWDAELNSLGQDFVAPWARDTALVRALGEDYLNTGDRANDLDNLSPRIAVAWDLARAVRPTTLRAGFGLLYDRVPIFGAVDERIAAGWRTYEFAQPGTTDPDELRRRVVAGEGRSAPNLVVLRDRLETPRSRQWSVGVGHRLADHAVLNVDLVRQRLSRTYVTVNANWRDGVTGRRAITERYGSILAWDDLGDARYDALLAAITYHRDLTRLNVAWTLARSRSEFGALTTGNYPHASSYTLQRSDADERHRVAISGFGPLPFGVELSTIAIAASPRPFLVTTGTDDDHDGTTEDDWPDGVRTLRRRGWAHWYRTVDLRLGRSFAAPGGRLHLTAEAFNLFDWANHAEYQGTRSLARYGEPVADYARRQVQLGARYSF